jgi:hypothetical protein
MIRVVRGYGVILWLSGVVYLILGVALLMLGAIDGHWLLYCGIAALVIGLLPPLGLEGLALNLILWRGRRAVQWAANQNATSA